MKQFIARAVVTLPSGLVRVDTGQARTRAHNLLDVGGGVHRIERPIQFKAGERFEWDGEVPKALSSVIEEVSAETRTVAPAAQRKHKKFGGKLFA